MLKFTTLDNGLSYLFEIGAKDMYYFEVEWIREIANMAEPDRKKLQSYFVSRLGSNELRALLAWRPNDVKQAAIFYCEKEKTT